MTWQEVMEVLDAARRIGLTSIKFLGPGELFQNPDLFDILDACEARSMPISIFTKGAELGDDELAKRNFGHLGIETARQLVDRIANYRYLRILLGFNSFFTARQDAFVGSTSITSTYKVVNGSFEVRGIARYTEKRDQALVNLVRAGFNDIKRGQHLTLVMAPIHRNQVDEVSEIYEWAARRNMPLIVTPSMESGPKAQDLVRGLQKADPENDWLREVYRRVYRRAFDIGITTFSELEHKGLSAYIGTEGCNQVANGLMIRLNGQVKICPGSSRPSHIYGNVHDQDGNLHPEKIIELWLASPNYKMGALENNWCPAKNQMLPYKLQGEVIEELRLQNNSITILSTALQTQLTSFSP